MKRFFHAGHMFEAEPLADVLGDWKVKLNGRGRSMVVLRLKGYKWAVSEGQPRALHEALLQAAEEIVLEDAEDRLGDGQPNLGPLGQMVAQTNEQFRESLAKAILGEDDL